MVLTLCKSLSNLNTTTRREQAVTNGKFAKRRPASQNFHEGRRAHDRKCVVLQIQNLEIAGVAQPLLQQQRNTLLTDTVLGHTHRANSSGVHLVGTSPSRHTAIFQPVTSADDAFQERNLLSFLASFFLTLRKLAERIRNVCSGRGTQSVVVQNKVAQGHVAREEIDERGLRVETEGIVGQVNGVQGRDLQESIQESCQSLGKLGEQSRSENIGQFGHLKVLLCREGGCEALACGYTKSVPTQTNFGKVGAFEKRLDLRFNIFRRVKLEALAFERKDLWRGHGGVFYLIFFSGAKSWKECENWQEQRCQRPESTNRTRNN